MNWMYSVALSRICAREAWRFKQANYSFFSCFPAFSDTVLTRLLQVLFLGRNTSRAQLTKGTVYPDTTQLYSLQCYRSLLSSPSPPAKQARNLVNRGSCLWCDPCVCARARCDALVCLPTKKKVKLRKFPESCVKIIYANSVAFLYYNLREKFQLRLNRTVGTVCTVNYILISQEKCTICNQFTWCQGQHLWPTEHENINSTSSGLPWVSSYLYLQFVYKFKQAYASGIFIKYVFSSFFNVYI